ncbi:magnesium transporter [Lachnospiraceae bacterium XBB1006]|nr:magnesium transporter [Lachnospiraceae bacterium XBB1006]
MQEEYFDTNYLEDDLEKIKELVDQRKYTQLKELLADTNEADVAAIFEELNEKELPLVFRLLGKEEAAEVFAYMEHDTQTTLVNSLTDKELEQILDDLFLDDTVDMIEEMPANVVARILRNTDEKTRKQINELLKYPKDSAGAMMTVEYVNIKKNMTVGEAIARIRKMASNSETVYTVYVTENRKLIGLCTVKDLLISNDDERIEDIMETKIITLSTADDQEDVAKMFNKYGFLAFPVVDHDDRLVGIITVDDAMEVLQDENTEDITRMAAITSAEDTYFKTSIFKHAKNRIAWLLVLMLSSTITGTIITSYENAFAAVPLLVSFIPMLMDTGGNCGSQSSTLIIRGIALDEIVFKDIFKVVAKEFGVSIIVGCVLAVVNGIRIFLMYKNAQLAMVVALSLVVTIMLAKFIGGVLPLTAKKIGLDPALMASPLITTVVDTCSILVYFRIATIFFHIA